MIDTIRVPALSATEIISAAKRKFDLRRDPPHLADWNFMRDEAGRTYEVLTHNFGRDVTCREVQSFFREKGFSGNTAAFVAWLTERTPFGAFATIPDEDRLFRIPDTNLLFAPTFDRKRDSRLIWLNTRFVASAWYGHWVFVAFRAISP